MQMGNAAQKFSGWKGATVLVTGAGGFIGSHLVERLLELGASVRAFVHYNSRNDIGFLDQMSGRAPQLSVITGDVADLQVLRNATTGADIVFHLAALVGIPYSYEHAHHVVEVNTIGTLNMLTASRDAGVKRFVQTSTSEVYGTARTAPITEAHPKQPQSPYSASKISADALALSFFHSYGLPVTICRPFNTYGPRQSDRAIIPALLAQAIDQPQITVGNLTPTRDFTFVTDTAEGFIKLAESDRCLGEEINLGSGSEITIGDLVKKILRLVGRDIPIVESSERKRPASSEVQRLLSDNSKARELAGWQPKVTLEEGLRKTLEWVSAQRHLYEPGQYRK